MIEQLLQFTQNHWLLCSLFFTTLALIVFEEIRCKLTNFPQISPRDAVILLNQENATILDLRNQKAFSNGHILGSINIASADVEQNLKKLAPYKNNPLILVDDNAANTDSIGSKLRTQGFTKIQTLAGGLASWKDAELPLNKL